MHFVGLAGEQIKDARTEPFIHVLEQFVLNKTPLPVSKTKTLPISTTLPTTKQVQKNKIAVTSALKKDKI